MSINRLMMAFQSLLVPVLCFFFQAEDGIRDYKVTGVQTCALPILLAYLATELYEPLHPVFAVTQMEILLDVHFDERAFQRAVGGVLENVAQKRIARPRSEERRVGKEGMRGSWQDEWEGQA